MAHHLAELITRAQRTKDSAERAAAQDRAVETILRIWDHRATSDRINPFAELGPVLKVLRTLADDSPPWAYLPAGTSGRAAQRTYDLLRRLTICLSLLELRDIETLRQGLTRARRSADHQSKEEQELLAHLSPWLNNFAKPVKTATRAPRKVARGVDRNSNHPDPSRIAKQILGQIRTAADELDDELRKRDLKRDSDSPKA